MLDQQNMKNQSEEIFEIIRRKLLLWFEKNGRDLPWRAAYSSYEVWISEIMLQQTQVKTMLPYYSRWMSRFPNPASIAEAHEDEVLRCWEGLGYYSRARNIHKAARMIVDEHGGSIPKDFQSVLKLPGVGEYTAGAIMSIAFNADYPAADANAARVFARIFNISDPSGSKRFTDSIRQYASGCLPSGRSREFNQALMDLGSSVCIPGEPGCAECPLASCCASNAAGVAAQRPVKSPKKPPTPVVRAVGILVSGRKVLVRKRAESGLMPSLYEFPGGDAHEGETPEAAIRRVWREQLGIDPSQVESLTIIKHAHTSFRVTLHAYVCATTGSEVIKAGGASPVRWATPEQLKELAFPSAHRKIITAFLMRQS